MRLEATKPLSILIVEDHPIFRQALRNYLETRPEQYQVIGEADKGQLGVALAKQHTPHIILLDLGLPEKTISGIEEGLVTISEIRRASPDSHIVVLTLYEQLDTILSAIQAGATTYLLKRNICGEDILDCLEQLQAGKRPIDSYVTDKIWRNLQGEQAIITLPTDELTSRELEVLQLVSSDYTNDDIANKLNISMATVKTHLRNIRSKLNLGNRLALKAYYMSRYAN